MSGVDQNSKVSEECFRFRFQSRSWNSVTLTKNVKVNYRN